MPAEALIQFQNVTKQFGDLRANENISFFVKKGSIHGIIGENGAGKSTAMKILYGMYSATSGRIILDGKEFSPRSPLEALAAGIGMVQQHFLLAHGHTTLDNILLGKEGVPFWRRIPRESAKKNLEVLMQRHGFSVPLEKNTEALSVGEQQKAEIVKLLYRKARILILDEPTAVLAPQEIEEFFNELRRLRDEGCTVLLITHKLKEILAITDRVTIFRAGRVVAERETAETNLEELAESMVGERIALAAPEENSAGERLLGVHWPSGETLEVRAGEIVGIAGVEGNGQSELLDALLFPKTGDFSVEWFGNAAAKLSTEEIRLMGVGVFSQDRLRQDLLESFSLEENLLLNPGWRKRFAARSINKRALLSAGKSVLEKFNVKPANLRQTAGAFSGGNQQKFVAGRELELNPRFLIAAHPTRGVDIGAAQSIHEKIRAVARSGGGVLLVSSDLDEIRALSHRVCVLYRGKVAAEFGRMPQERDLGMAMMGGGS